MKPLIFIMILWCWAFYAGQQYYSGGDGYYSDKNGVIQSIRHFDLPTFRFNEIIANFPTEQYSYIRDGKPSKEDLEDFKQIQITFTEAQKKNIADYKEEIKPVKIGFSEGMLLYKYNEQYGYADRTGRTIRGPVYSQASFFKDGAAVVESIEDNLTLMFPHYLIDSAENTIAGPFSGIGDYSEGLMPVYDGNKRYYITSDGKKALDCPDLLYMRSFFNGYARVEDSKTDKVGIIDRSGHFVVPCQYCELSEMVNGIAFAQKNRKNDDCILVTADGKELPGVYQDLRWTSDGNILFQKDNYRGVMDTRRNLILLPVFNGNIYHKGLAFDYLFFTYRGTSGYYLWRPPGEIYFSRGYRWF